MDECKAVGVKAMGLEVDLTDRVAAEKAIATIVKEMGRIDIAICNAGGGTVRFADEIKPGEEVVGRSGRAGETRAGDAVTTGTPADCRQDMLTRVLDINLMTCMYTCMAVAPYMKQQRSGKIVTVSSTAGLEPSRSYHPYGMAKAAIVFYTRSLAMELGPYNINVNCIAPGIIRTGRMGDRSKIGEQTILKREGTIEDCARIVEFLTTELSDYVTGNVISA
jgi:3-oxoacyl-[acyl-carrier protein] reductase